GPGAEPERARHAARARIAVAARGGAASGKDDARGAATSTTAPHRRAGRQTACRRFAWSHAGYAGTAGAPADAGAKARTRTGAVAPGAPGVARERCRADRYGAAPRGCVAAAGRSGPDSHRAHDAQAYIQPRAWTAALPRSI